MIEFLKQDLAQMLQENWGFIKIVLAFVAYSFLEYYLGKTDRVAEGSVLEFTWARVKGLFSPSKGIKDEPKAE